MARSSGLLTSNPSVLPANLLELKDDAFYNLVQEITSSDEAELLRVQSIRSVHCFMRINVLNFFHLDSDDLVPLQSRLAHKKADGKYAVHLGIRGSIIYLTELFNGFKKQKPKETQTNGNTSVEAGNLTVASKDPIPSQNTSIPESTASVASPLLRRSPTKTVISSSEHRTHVKHNVQVWWNNVRGKHGLADQTLLEPNDYKLVVTDNSVSIICSCGTSIILRCPSGRKHYQLSNYYQHVVGSERCDLITRKQRSQQRDNDPEDSQTSSPPQVTTDEQPTK
jgi:hypothetical protein